MLILGRIGHLGESVTERTVARRPKRAGDRAEIDEALVQVSADEVDTEIPPPYAGVIEEMLVFEDRIAEVCAPRVRIGLDRANIGTDSTRTLTSLASRRRPCCATPNWRTS